jgi:hypothetical protein
MGKGVLFNEYIINKVNLPLLNIPYALINYALTLISEALEI